MYAWLKTLKAPSFSGVIISYLTADDHEKRFHILSKAKQSIAFSRGRWDNLFNLRYYDRVNDLSVILNKSGDVVTTFYGKGQ